MKILGIILLVFQAISIYGLIISGDSLPNSIPGLIGYFWAAIIGVILLIKASKKKAKKDAEEKAKEKVSE